MPHELKTPALGVAVVAQQVKDPTECEGAGLIPGLAQWLKGPMLPEAVV